MKNRIFCLLLMLILLAGRVCAWAEPDLTLQDTSLRPGVWAEADFRKAYGTDFPDFRPSRPRPG